MNTEQIAASAEIIDLDLIAPADTGMLKIVDPSTGEPIGLTLILAGPDHPKTIEIQDATARRMAKREAQNASQMARGRNAVIAPEDPEKVRAENIRGIAGRVLGWTPDKIKLGGIVRSYSPTAAYDLLSDRKFTWIFVQVVDYLNGDAAFMKPSATN